jgi:adenylate cyclase
MVLRAQLTGGGSELGRDGVERRLAAILSADVVGYSRLMAEDEDGTVRRLTDYREEIAMLVRQHRGRVVDSPGDNLLAEFPAALDAVSGAVEVQRVLQVRNADLPVERRMEFRIGVHLGDVRVEGERIYGDGVNIAARLEGLAEAGGICISRTVHEQVQHRLDLGYEDLGEQEIKNLPEPVRVYRVRLRPEANIPTENLPGMKDLTVPGFSGRPAIAVLPFDNLSGDPEQEYFADGIAEDLITRLSSWRWVPVIARNSSFVYRGKAVDVKQLSRELGVRYVVEGSVRKAGNRVRISAQLIDATTGHHVWAERYDRELSDIFALQDEITEAIVGSMDPELRDYEWERAVRKEPQNLDAWETAQRGWWHWSQLTREDNRTARSFFQKAADLDPRFSGAFAGLAWTHYMDLAFQWSESPERSIAQLGQTAKRSVALDSKDPIGQESLGLAYNVTGQLDKAVTTLQLVVRFNPSATRAHFMLGVMLARSGRPDEGIEHLDKALRLSPHDQMVWAFLYGMAVAHFSAGRYEEAVNWAKRSLEHRADYPRIHTIIAASYAHLGRIDEARAAVQELAQGHPDFSLSGVMVFMSSADPDFAGRYLEGLRKAGLKE